MEFTPEQLQQLAGMLQKLQQEQQAMMPQSYNIPPEQFDARMNMFADLPQRDQQARGTSTTGSGGVILSPDPVRRVQQNKQARRETFPTPAEAAKSAGMTQAGFNALRGGDAHNQAAQLGFVTGVTPQEQFAANMAVGRYRDFAKGQREGTNVKEVQIPATEWSKDLSFRVGKEGAGTIGANGLPQMSGRYGTASMTNPPAPAVVPPPTPPPAPVDQTGQGGTNGTTVTWEDTPEQAIARVQRKIITPQQASLESGKPAKGAPRGMLGTPATNIFVPPSQPSAGTVNLDLAQPPITLPQDPVNRAGAGLTKSLQPSFNAANETLGNIFAPVNQVGEAVAQPIANVGQAIYSPLKWLAGAYNSAAEPVARGFNNAMAGLFTVPPENQQALADSMDYTKRPASKLKGALARR